MSNSDQTDLINPVEMLGILKAVRTRAETVTGSDALLKKLDVAIAQLCTLYGLRPDGNHERRH